MRRSVLALLALVLLPLPAVAQNYPTRPIKAIASQGPGGLSDLFMRGACRPARSGARHVDRGRGPRRRGRHDRRPGLRGGAAGRLHHLHPSRRDRHHQSDHPAEFGFRPGQEPGADHQGLLPDAGVCGRRLAQCQIVRRPGEARQSPSPTRSTTWRLRCRRSPSCRSSTRRTAPTSCACRSRAAATPSTACSPAPRRSRFSASATWCPSSAPERSSASPSTAIRARRSRPTFRPSRRSATPSILRRPSSASSRPAGTPKPIVDKLYKAIAAIGAKPDFQQKFLFSRGLAPVFSPPDQFAKELVGDRAEGLAAVKESGLYPNVK